MKKLFKKFEDLMVAITFAEAGEYETANEILNQQENIKIEPIVEQVREAV